MNDSLPDSRPPSGNHSNVSLPHVIARNTFFNLITQGLLIVAALWSLPLVITGLSEEGFGLLSLVWVFVGYFSFFDFGISRAITKFLAEAIVRGAVEDVSRIVRTSIVGTLVVGVVTGGVVCLCSPFIVTHVFTIRDALTPDAIAAFRIAGLGIPFMLMLGTIRGFQMALQRFDISNVFQLVIGIPQWIGSVLLLRNGYGFSEVIWLTIGIRMFMAIFGVATLPRLFHGVYRSSKLVDRAMLKKLWSFSGWVTVSQAISPLFMYIERIIITMFLPLAVVAHYAVPQEALTRVLVLAVSFTAALFPALSGESSRSELESKVILLYRRSMKYLVLGLFPLVISFVFLSPEILKFWLGDEFASHCILIAQIIAIGVFFNSVSQIPMTVLHAFGRPDVTAKFHLLELPVAIVLGLVLIPWLGAEGAAIGWSLRVVLDAALLFVWAHRMIGDADRRPITRAMAEKYVILLGSLLGIVSIVLFIPGAAVKIVLVLVCLVVYSATTWIYAFDDLDRNFFIAIGPRMFRRV